MFDFLRPLNFGHRLLLYRLVIGLFVAGMTYSAFFIPGSGERALKRAIQATSHATSWKMQYARPAGAGLPQMDALIEMACPSSSRMTQTWVTQLNGREDSWIDIRMTTNGASYFFNSKENIWHRNDTAGRNPHGDCGLMARGEDSRNLPPLNRWMHYGFLKKGELRDTGLGQCQEWLVTLPRGRDSPVDHASVCLGVDDNLPRFATEDGLTSSYFDWNLPVDFKPPEMADQQQTLPLVQ